MTLTPAHVALAVRLWAAGTPEPAVAEAVGISLTSFRRARAPGGPLSCLPRRPAAARDCGRRAEVVDPAELIRRAAQVRISWPPAEREQRSKGIVPLIRGKPVDRLPPSPFPAGHGLRILPAPRSR